MRKFICTLLVALLVSTAFAQNGGQAPENNSVKIAFAGFGKTNIYNKQSCEATIKVEYLGSTQEVIVAPGSYFQLTTTAPGTVKAKSMTNCGNADLGFVELVITAQTLPVKFVSLSVKPLGNKEVMVTFEIAEAIDVEKFNIQYSLDGVNWRTGTVVLPDPVQPNRVYNVKMVIASLKEN